MRTFTKEDYQEAQEPQTVLPEQPPWGKEFLQSPLGEREPQPKKPYVFSAVN